MGHIAAEHCAKCRCVVCEDLRVVRATRDGDVGHAVVEQVLCAMVGIHVDQYTV